MLGEGIVDLRRIQLGNEMVNTGAAGTPVVANRKWRGVGNWEDASVLTRPPENVGILGGTARIYKAMALARLPIEAGPLNAEQLNYFLISSMRGLNAGIQDGAGSDYIRTYAQPLNEDVIVVKAATISFVLATSLIEDSGTGFGHIIIGDTIVVSGSTSNDGIYTVTAAAAGELTVAESVADESVGATVEVSITPCFLTAQAGSNQVVMQSSYVFTESFEITGEGGAESDAIMMAGAMVGRQWVEDASGWDTATLPVVSDMIFSKMKLYIDAVGGTMGTTEKAGLMTNFTYASNPGIAHLFAAHGQEYFYNAKLRRRPTHSLEIGMRWNSDAQAERLKWLAGTPSLIELKCEGAALSSAGTTYSVKTVRIQLPGTWSQFPSSDDLEGAERITASFTPSYEATSGLTPTIVVVDEQASLM